MVQKDLIEKHLFGLKKDVVVVMATPRDGHDVNSGCDGQMAMVMAMIDVW